MVSSVLDFDKFDNFSDQDDEIKLALEAIGRAIDIETLGRLFARLDEVIDNLGFDLEFVFED